MLDVAGGKGELAWELLNLNLIPAVVLEPRMLELQSVERKWHNGIFWRNPIFHSHLHCAHDASVTPKPPGHLRLLLTFALVGWLHSQRCKSHGFDNLGNLSAFNESRRKAADLRWTRKGLRSHEDVQDVEQSGDDEVDEQPDHETSQQSQNKIQQNPHPTCGSSAELRATLQGFSTQCWLLSSLLCNEAR